jgi:hypothetical protein
VGIPNLFQNSLHQPNSTFTPSIIYGLFSTATHLSPNAIAFVIGKSSKTVWRALSRKRKVDELHLRSQPLNVKKPRLSPGTIEEAMNVAQEVAITPSGRNYVILKYSDSAFYEKCRQQCKVLLVCCYILLRFVVRTVRFLQRRSSSNSSMTPFMCTTLPKPIRRVRFAD